MIRRYLALFLVIVAISAQDTEPAVLSCAIFVVLCTVAWLLCCWAHYDETGKFQVFPDSWGMKW